MNGTLQFEKVTRSDAGNYTCIASNRPQGEIRAYVSLTVGGERSRNDLECEITIVTLNKTVGPNQGRGRIQATNNKLKWVSE